ncbi:GlxA family transcriptional regulator [Limimaricola pyoseonensis]|uniref:Transcriptional regulator GlxA family, contains an amidase domain and an AraC-type DNA-binding HTH domain n=1 Tax=Limimaricola pyoseonensis TaxID=521013 RepID=A0A1G7FTS3_9RHOB|nr:GlxA family transcriptional regulator [Limimaricola pyoseonensis]SDE79192.1 Transcriptional regulator GlxA family, contains an amidase domain and an AraC-type DNA-binding HTH domain [Limimaricola pyoseonensis]
MTAAFSSASRPAPAPRPAAAEPRLRVGFLLARRFTLSAFANFVDVLRLAADEGDRSRPILCRWRVIAEKLEPIRSSCGVTVGPEEKLGDPARFDYVVVIGGLMDSGGLTPAETAFLRRAAALKVPLVGVCTGAFILHEAGLMAGHRCCVSWFHHDDFLERFDGLVPVSDRVFVEDRGRLTCSGGAGSAHLAAHLVERHIGRAAARKSLHIMMIDEPMAPDDPQPGLPLDLKTRDPLVRRALRVMQQNLDAAPGVEEIAARLGVSRRKLERHMRAALGLGPAEAFTRVRLAHARFLLARPGASVTRIAAEAGFCDASHLIRVFRRHEGTTPEAWRRAMAGRIDA